MNGEQDTHITTTRQRRYPHPPPPARAQTTRTCCGIDIFSTGRCRSAMLAMEIIHLAVGAQKWRVKGPAGWETRPASFGLPFTNGRFSAAACNLGTMKPAAGAAMGAAGREGGVGWRLERADKDERGARLQPVFAWGCRPVTCTKGRQSRWSDELGGRGSRLRSSQHTHDGGCTGAHACRRRAQVNTGAGYTLHARNESLEKSARKNKLETEGFACAVAPHSTYHSSVRRWLRQ